MQHSFEICLWLFMPLWFVSLFLSIDEKNPLAWFLGSLIFAFIVDLTIFSVMNLVRIW